MYFKYSCFLSYRHGDKTMATFANQIVEALADELAMLLGDYKSLPIFKDDRSMEVGDKIDPAIAQALCQSVCMLVIYTPNYLSEEKLYCASELEGMLRAEQQRLAKITGANPKTGLLITVILRGDRESLPQILQDRENEDFSAFALYSSEIRRNRKFAPQVQQIAKKIQSYCAMFDKKEDWCSACQDFTLLDIKTQHDQLNKFLKTVKEGKMYVPDFDRS
ncbi:MAG: toll/interleukin-1 receptor domain-containing protein [Saprospiraceae bacterium]